MKKIYYLTLLAALSFFTACSYEEDIAEIRQELDAIKVTQKELLEAYNSGKLITNVTSTEDGNGWLISFSDNTFITINSGKNGNDGVTPYLKIDENNYWIVSYDNGETFNVLLDKDSNPVVAVGKDGEKGADGNSIRIKTNDQSQYVIEIYNPTTGEVVDTIETKYVENSRNVIKSIVEDDKTNTITITM